nr:glycerol-3-phosphate dehydrogenase/oxidase [Mucilaginibacter sp. L294]
MNTADKHFKFINSKTGYVIFYSSLSTTLSPNEVKAELDKIKAQVAIKNGIYQETVYWEEIKDE